MASAARATNASDHSTSANGAACGHVTDGSLICPFGRRRVPPVSKHGVTAGAAPTIVVSVKHPPHARPVAALRASRFTTPGRGGASSRGSRYSPMSRPQSISTGTSAPGTTYMPLSGSAIPVHRSHSATVAVTRIAADAGRRISPPTRAWTRIHGVERRAVIAAPANVALDRNERISVLLGRAYRRPELGETVAPDHFRRESSTRRLA
jgi:hypothetical protein